MTQRIFKHVHKVGAKDLNPRYDEDYYFIDGTRATKETFRDEITKELMRVTDIRNCSKKITTETTIKT